MVEVDVDALELIKQDQDAIKKLFDDALANNDPAARAGLLQHIRAELTAHKRMKDDVFYPALRAGGDKAKSIMLDGLDSPLLTDVILDELLEVPEETDHWQAKLKVLKSNLEQQVEAEAELFTRARGALSQVTLTDLGAKMAAIRKRA
ncbi:MAG TPA: hemerythrin domain-containing protein [Vicinamibacterales bacterium]|nr:hemerythrin domain-containing protein [Vicinamibacterales bacterium]